MNDLERLAAFAAELSARDLPASVRVHCGTLAADSVACTLGALRTAEGRAIARALTDVGSGGAAGAGLRGAGAAPQAYRVYFSGDALAGVRADADLANLLDYDDVFEGSGHIGCVVVPPAMRIGALLGTGGDDVAAALAAGFEVSARVLEASRPSEAARAAIWGIGTRQAPAVAAVAARLLGLPARATAHALALACAAAPVPSVRKTVYGDTGVTWLKNNMGAAAAAGLAAALMAREGARGPLDILDGPQGFSRMIGTDTWTPRALTDGLGATWQIERIGLKPYPCCRHAHGVIDAARQVLEELRVEPAAIHEIAVAGPVWVHGVPFTNPAPQTMHDAQYSLPYCVAVTLLGVEPGLSWFEPALYSRADVRALAARVRIEPQPEGGAGGSVRMTAGGRTRTTAVRLPRGSPALPLSPVEREAKYRHLLGALLPPDRIRQSYADLTELPPTLDVRALVAALPKVDLAAQPPARVTV